MWLSAPFRSTHSSARRQQAVAANAQAEAPAALAGGPPEAANVPLRQPPLVFPPPPGRPSANAPHPLAHPLPQRPAEASPPRWRRPAHHVAMVSARPAAPPTPEVERRPWPTPAGRGVVQRSSARRGEVSTDSLESNFVFDEPSETWEDSAAVNCVPYDRRREVAASLPRALAGLEALTFCSASPAGPRFSSRRRQIPLPALVAGVALCGNVVREPIGTDPAHHGSWAVGASAAERLFARARQSQWGTALAPHHTHLTVGMFPPPWRKLARAWMNYASNVCELTPQRSSAILAALAEFRGSKVVPSGYLFVAGDVRLWVSWTMDLCDQLLLGYYRNFCGGRVPLGPPLHLALEPQSSAQVPVPMERFSAQAFAFGYYGRLALYTFGSHEDLAPRGAEPELPHGAEPEAFAAVRAQSRSARAARGGPSAWDGWDGQTLLGSVHLGESAASPA